MAGRAEGLREGDLTGCVSRLGGVDVLHATEVVVDGDGLAGEERSARLQGAGEGDGLADGRIAIRGGDLRGGGRVRRYRGRGSERSEY